MKKLSLALLSLGLLTSPVIFADQADQNTKDVPVIDLSTHYQAPNKGANAQAAQQNTQLADNQQGAIPVNAPNTVVYQGGAAQDAATTAKSQLTDAQRLTRLENQMTYLQQMDLAGQLANLQQAIQDLRGQQELQAHKLAQLVKQQRDLYADLDARLSRLSKGEKSPADNPSQQAAPKGDSNAKGAGNDLLQQQSDYQSAYKLLQQGHYTRAMDALDAFLAAYPQSRYAANAHYWIGELYLMQGQLDKASDAFQTVIKNYPQSKRKVIDSKLKLGFLAYDQGDWKEAKSRLQEVVKNYPNTSAARLATERLKQMQKQGH